MTWPMFLALIVTALIGTCACAYNYQHARDRFSPEPYPTAPWHMLGAAFCAAVMVLAMLNVALRWCDSNTMGAILWTILLAATVYFVGRSYVNRRDRKRKERYYGRRAMAPAILALLLLPAFGGGCAGRAVGPDGKPTTQPLVSQADIDLVAEVASSYVTVFMPPGPKQTQILAEIELARKLGDMTALLAARLQAEKAVAQAPPAAAARDLAAPALPPSETVSLRARVVPLFNPFGGIMGNCSSLIDRAKFVRIQAFTFTSRPVAEALKRAQARGADVMVIVDASNRADAKSLAGELAAAGVKVYVDGAHAIAHSKILVADKLVGTGSANFTEAAEGRNAENFVFISNAPAVLRGYLDSFNDHLQHSQPW